MSLKSLAHAFVSMSYGRHHHLLCRTGQYSLNLCTHSQWRGLLIWQLVYLSVETHPLSLFVNMGSVSGNLKFIHYP